MIIKNKIFILSVVSLVIFSFFWITGLELVFAQNAIVENIPVTGLPDNSGGIADILSSILSWLLGVLGVIAIISFVISGIMYLTASGNERQLDTAKRAMTYSIIGVVVALSGYIVVRAVDYALRGYSSF